MLVAFVLFSCGVVALAVLTILNEARIRSLERRLNDVS